MEIRSGPSRALRKCLKQIQSHLNKKLIEITDLVSRMKEQNTSLNYDLYKMKKIKVDTYSYTKWYWFVGIVIVLYIIGAKK